jgi:hypothetical protein
MIKSILFMGSIAGILSFLGCKNKSKDQFGDILNDTRVNSKEVGQREGIKYFQVVKDGKYGFRDLDGKIVIDAIFDMAEMFSEGLSTVQVGQKYGLIDENGSYVLPLSPFDYLGSVHDGLASYRANNKYGFIDIHGKTIIKPQFDWVDEFSEGLCVVRNDSGKSGTGKYGYIDATGKTVIDLKYQYANKFEGGKAKIEIDNLWGEIDKTGKILEPASHKYSSW